MQREVEMEEPQLTALKEIIKVSLKVSDSPEEVRSIFERSFIELSEELEPISFVKPQEECLRNLIVHLSKYPVARISAKKIFTDHNINLN
jgi:hypothetical protein